MSPTVLGPGMHFDSRSVLITDRVFTDHLDYLRRRDGAVPRDLVHLADAVHVFAAGIRRNLPPHHPRTNRPVTVGSSTASEWLTADQAATLTGMSTGYICRLARRGDLYATRAADGRTWLIDSDSLTAWTTTRTSPEPP